MTFGQSIAACFRKYADFTGVARRSEFWWFILFTTLVAAALQPWQISGENWTFATSSYLAYLWSLATLLPTLAVLVRRLRDTGRGWGHVFWLLVPIAGLIVLAIFLSEPGRFSGAGIPTDRPTDHRSDRPTPGDDRIHDAPTAP